MVDRERFSREFEQLLDGHFELVPDGEISDIAAQFRGVARVDGGQTLQGLVHSFLGRRSDGDVGTGCQGLFGHSEANARGTSNEEDVLVCQSVRHGSWEIISDQ